MDIQDLESIEARLDNIRSIEPILNALRTISAGGWRAALSRLKSAQRYAEYLREAVRTLLPQLSDRPIIAWNRPPSSRAAVCVLIIGSNHGLCGEFNEVVIAKAESFICDLRQVGRSVNLLFLGQRIQRHFERRGERPVWSEPLPSLTGPSFQQIHSLVQDVLPNYERGRWGFFYAVYNAYHGASIYSPRVEQIIPPRDMLSLKEREPWPPTIIEGDPARLYSLLMMQWVTVSLYQIALQSAAAEQSARFRLLDGAGQNIERLIEELTQIYHSARQHEITMEMLDILGASGMLGRAI